MGYTLILHDKKIPGPSMCSPGACARRVGIYFPGMLLLYGYAFTFRACIYFPGRSILLGQAFTFRVGIVLFRMIKKKSRPQHVLSGCLCSPCRHLLSGYAFTFRVCIYFPGSHILLFCMIKKKK